MYYIIVDNEREFITIHKDLNDKLLIVDITNEPFLYGDENGEFNSYDKITQVINHLSLVFKTNKISCRKVNSFSEISRNINK